MRLLVALIVLASIASTAGAVDPKDRIYHPGTQAVAAYGGDCFNTYAVTISSSVATQIRPAVTDRSRRRLRIHNRSSIFRVSIGSSTVIASDQYTLGESTNSATLPFYDTNNSAAIYAVIDNAPATGTAVSATIRAIEEVSCGN